jgi:hypothetical protein
VTVQLRPLPPYSKLASLLLTFSIQFGRLYRPSISHRYNRKVKTGKVTEGAAALQRNHGVFVQKE